MVEDCISTKNDFKNGRIDVRMKKDNRKENKYFYVFDIEDAERIRDLTGEIYYKFADRYTGNTFYSFRKTKEIIVAYKLIMSYKSKIEKNFK